VKLLKEGGVLTAANSSQICDGAAGVLIVNEQALKTHGLRPLARIRHLTVTGGAVIMLEEPILATRRALERSGLKLENIDLYEINEAFACVPLAWLQAIGADSERVNVHGGAIALGHPLGANTGGRRRVKYRTSLAKTTSPWRSSVSAIFCQRPISSF
jgi:acetyl-CoA C-acetyltransferase